MGKKLSRSRVVEALNKKGYSMIESEYKTLKEKHILIDEKGYMYYSSLDNLINLDRKPEKFSPINPFTLENIQHHLDENGSKTKVLSDSYKNAHSKLKLRCGECGNEYEVSANHLISRNAVICPECSLREKGKRRRVPFSTVKEEFEKSDLIPLFTSYDGYYVPLKCKDVRGNLCYITYAALRQWNRHGYSTYLPHHSSYESLVRKYLYSLDVVFLSEYTFPDCKDVNRLKFDFAVFKNSADELPALLIEVDGQQHFNPVRFRRMKAEDVYENFKGIQRRDYIKNEFCIKNNIKLLRIPFYEVENENYKTIISKNISQTLWSSEP